MGLGELARSLDSPKHSPRLVSWPSEACLGDWGPPGGRAFEQGQGHRQRGWVRSCTGSLLSHWQGPPKAPGQGVAFMWRQWELPGASVKEGCGHVCVLGSVGEGRD